MGIEEPKSESTRLKNEQRKTREDEVFGGLSPAVLLPVRLRSSAKQ
jgi:hypothetical protein